MLQSAPIILMPAIVAATRKAAFDTGAHLCHSFALRRRPSS